MEDWSVDPPAWVRKRDGRLVPFEADRISRALFAATESLGQPNVFLARELADSVVHFLSEESTGSPPTTADLAELVVKVVRELGQPALAETFATHSQRRVQTRSTAGSSSTPPAPRQGEIVLRFDWDMPAEDLLPQLWHAYTLQRAFTRDLAAAHDAGLLVLTGLHHPDHLAACLLPAPMPPGLSLTSLIEGMRRFVGSLLVLDSPDYLLTDSPSSSVDAFVVELAQALDRCGLQAVVNLNCSDPPPAAGEPAQGPLFAQLAPTVPAEQRAQTADRLADRLLEMPGVRIDWHVGAADLATGAEQRLLRRVAQAIQGKAICLVFDRPGQPIALAEGMDRRQGAVLLTVGLDLPRLAQQPGIEGDPERFLHKLESLTRLAVSAAVQKRVHLRQRERSRPPAPEMPSVTSGFLLDRACLLAAPIGLDHLVASLLGRSLATGGQAVDLGRQIVQRIRAVLHQTGRTVQLDGGVDGPAGFALDGDSSRPERVAGLTPWDPSASWKNVLRAGGALHAAADRGTLALHLPEGSASSAEQAAAIVRAAWQQTRIVRLRCILAQAPSASAGIR